MSIKVIQISEITGSVFLLALVSAEPDLCLVFFMDLIVFGCLLDIVFKKLCCGGFPGGAVVENLPANSGDTGLSPGLGRPHMPRSN